MIRVEALHKAFQAHGRKSVKAVCGASFTGGAGEIMGLLGPNGAGKTTLLRMIGTLISPTAGTCDVAGHSTSEAPDEVRRHIGFLSGNTKLYGRLSGAEVLQYFGRLHGMTDAAIAQRMTELADALDMQGFLHQRCETLSTGQTQKVSIARVLLHDPPVLILDEPTLGLDILTSRTILEFIMQAKERGRAIIFSTHYMTEAELLCDHIGLIHRGRILAQGTKQELYAQTETDNLKDAFLSLVEDDAGENV